MKKVISKNIVLRDSAKKVLKIIIEPEKTAAFLARQTMSEAKNHSRQLRNLNPEETQIWLSFPTPRP